MTVRLSSLIFMCTALLLLWASPPRRRRRRVGRRRTEEERLRAWGDSLRKNPHTHPHEWEEFNTAWNDFNVRKARREIRPVLRRRPQLIHSKHGRRLRRGRRLKSVLWVALVATIGVLLSGIVAGMAGIQPFSTYTDSYLPFTKAQAPAPHPAVAVVVATDTPAPTATVTSIPPSPTTTPFVAKTIPLPTVTPVLTSTSVPPTTTPPTLPATSPPTPSVAPVPTLTPVPPTTTPTPNKHLRLETESKIKGYWSDGTADIELKMSLMNQGRLQFEDRQAIIVSCSVKGDSSDSCSTDTEISLSDGFAPAATSVTLRAPMGLVTLEIDYGGDATSIVQLNVPERILGVTRDTWECYSDRDTSTNPEEFQGCYGWYSATVEKWRTGSTVRVWATGNEGYIRAFKETLDEQFAPVLNLTFEWADSEFDADLVAVVGVSRSEEYGDRWSERCLHAWGCGGVNDVRNGEVREGDLVVFHLEKHDRFLGDYPNLKKVLNGVFIHEGLHALAPTGHADPRKVVLSSMYTAGYFTYIDKAILSLNSHPLVKPDMTMQEVESLIVFHDELLDNPQKKLDSYDVLEHTLAALQRVDTARMKVKGGWTGGTCDKRFGKREWATLEIGNFKYPDIPRLALLTDGHERFVIFHSDEAKAIDGDGWRHYWQRDGGDWKELTRNELWDSTSWWIENSKMHQAISDLLWYYDADDIKISDRTDGIITLSAEYNPSETSTFGKKDESRTFTLAIDENTYKVLRYEWIHSNHEWDYCHTYTEIGQDIQYGVDIEVPDADILGSEFAVPTATNWAR